MTQSILLNQQCGEMPEASVYTLNCFFPLRMVQFEYLLWYGTTRLPVSLHASLPPKSPRFMPESPTSKRRGTRRRKFWRLLPSLEIPL